MQPNPLFLTDFYKADHRSQYPPKTTLVYSNFTPRKSRLPEIDYIVTFGLQYLCHEYLINQFNNNFFNKPVTQVVKEYQNRLDTSIGPNLISVDHIRELHNLGYLPIHISALPEGTISPIQTPILTYYNTHKNFAWLTNYLETLFSAVLWKPCTNAAVAAKFRAVFNKYAKETGVNEDFASWQGHDFSMRGMSGVEDAMISGAAHLLSFTGTDSIPAIDFVQYYYPTSQFIGGSVAATEHSTMCADDEHGVIIRLLTEVYPKGILSIVSDSYDFWDLVSNFYPSIKEIILARDGKLVVRPDTGVPHQVILGNPNGESEAEKKGLINILAENFGYTVNSLGFKSLNPKVGAIYGDSISLNEQKLILDGLKNNGFATDCVVLGIGSYTYQYCTRDTLGIACKATYIEVDGVGRNIFKNPKTGAWKKSHKGLLRVNEDYSTSEEVSWAESQTGMLRPLFRDGKLLVKESFDAIRGRLSRNSTRLGISHV